MDGKAQHFNKALISAFLLFVVSIPAQAEHDCPADHIDEYVTVSRVFDGDTLLLSDKRKIRLIAVNTPEIQHDKRQAEPLSEAAKQKLEELLPIGVRIGLRYDRDPQDRYHRQLAHVYRTDGLNVAADLIKQGYGFAIVVPPNDWATNCYFEMEQLAQANQRGIWSLRYYAQKAAGALSPESRGFMRVTGEVTRIGSGQKNFWLDMGENFSVRVKRSDLQYLDGLNITGLLHKTITVRGWVNYYNHKLRMSLRHTAMMKVSE